MPVSARWLSGLGAGAFLLPTSLLVMGYGTVGALLVLPALLCTVACFVPPFFSDPKRLRVACTVAGVVVALVSAPFAFLGMIFAIPFWYGTVYLAFLALPVTAIAGLSAGFQRARGRERGRATARFAWAAGAFALVGWMALAGVAITLPPTS
ncbi:hypothetical protein ACFWP2_02435 [Kitasatospora sp. NPDC058444]|uniref:hypothetical protein n=1 Tax=Kitasatospora sp. NPDC058444 TaxID=3346504 RepID=UPI0036661365